MPCHVVLRRSIGKSLWINSKPALVRGAQAKDHGQDSSYNSIHVTEEQERNELFIIQILLRG